MTEFKRILVPLDGSPVSERALPAALTLAKKFESQIFLLRVLDIPSPTPPISHPEETMGWIGWVQEARQQAHQEAQSYLEALQGELDRQGFKTRILLRDRAPAEDILDVVSAEAIDLIVISSHGRGGLARWMFGSVAEKVVRHSPCPVLVIRQQPETIEEP
ncbi:MAG: universal stress protein [Chloroflexota bacterium]|nr:universal stress protein [Chloroflexota bacterium]